MEQRVKVQSVEIRGNHRTDRSFFDNELQEALSSDSFLELHTSLVKTTKRLESFDVFRSVKTEIKIPTSVKGNEAIPIKIFIDVQEKNMLSSKVETFFEGEKANMGSSAQCNFRNVVGLGDVSKISFSSNNNGSREWLFGVHFPSVLKQLYSLDATFKVYEDASPISFAAFSKAITSFSLQVNSVDRRHSLELVAAFRDEIPKLPSNVSTTNSPPAVPSFSQLPIAFSSSLPTLYTLLPSTKSSISYSFTALDSRDSPSNPSKGSLLATKMELAFPPGSSQFAKIEGFIEKHTNLLSSPNTLVLSICSSVGAILGLKSQVNMSDRYFQGGGLFLRGWQMSGIGPRSSLSQETDGALGGTVRSNFLAAISAPFPFPFESSENLRTFAFLNLGTLLNYPIPSLSSQPWRLSTGCGFSYSMGPLRLEATYTFPLRYSPHDKLKPFQIGFGISMN